MIESHSFIELLPNEEKQQKPPYGIAGRPAEGFARSIVISGDISYFVSLLFNRNCSLFQRPVQVLQGSVPL
jgi:hypothetical protein